MNLQYLNLDEKAINNHVWLNILKINVGAYGHNIVSKRFHFEIFQKAPTSWHNSHLLIKTENLIRFAMWRIFKANVSILFILTAVKTLAARLT